MQRFDVIVLGAGAAGMFAAIEAGRRGRRVLVVDHAKAAGEKIRISGGGRCNFTNLGIAPERFISRNPRFALSALKRYTARDFVARVDAAGIGWHEKTLGQLFCDGSATQIVQMLLRDMAAAGVELWLGCTLGEVRREAGGFSVETGRGLVAGGAVIVATGGKSIPKMGATGYGYQVAGAFGLPLVETRPALVPLTFAAQELEWMAPLAGVSGQARVSCGKTGFDEAVLFTHRGLSGPAVLQISSYWREGEAVMLDLAPGVDVGAVLRAEKQAAGRAMLRTALGKLLPERLARHVEAAAGVTGPMAEMGRAKLDEVAAMVQRWSLVPVGSEGYRTAEVTLGGVDTDALDGRTMEAKGVPGLYFVGEVVDVTGWLGGYNFQWAWSSGWAAGQVA
ncbi:aminoacetone oxidase family FAD-binding enzyme [Gemmobacter aquarius]|uniref:Aminoacetone oxidase family FAD-binding enzyme n=1 Tax=Paragemmobacter aquarius TaxID=2169400 RepID=A0A2S0UL81_9RHOB|nr:NAD(P)/FAD-dependent oxidoreductase [Gemmobacter aquarius]AWB48568.1 aminoacetone oxidase family FAD-binding enzyme [Gemmobacter aquarius]